MKGLRIARSLSKNKIIINATGSWHGSVNETLYISEKDLSAKKLSDGLPNDTKKNIKFIPYGNINVSKKILDKYKKISIVYYLSQFKVLYQQIKILNI